MVLQRREHFALLEQRVDLGLSDHSEVLQETAEVGTVRVDRGDLLRHWSRLDAWVSGLAERSQNLVEVVAGTHLKEEAPDRFLKVACGIVAWRGEVVQVSRKTLRVNYLARVGQGFKDPLQELTLGSPVGDVGTLYR